ncbi:hypothetical protein RF11_06134 [Thelohanellus kitauei]|uniref:Uncharacterized protein n=1 Tax=Thelohanellus kitauei TaxID=669202 RepID=A0A0C2MT83_THEKT|nr:hypothetical protein RF11_06134 [Thelohanellus kitauei]
MSGLKEELGVHYFHKQNILTQCFAKLLLDFNEKKYVILFRCVESLKINTVPFFIEQDFQIIINNCLLATTNQIFAGRDIKNLQLNKDDSIIRKLMRKNLNVLLIIP